MVLGFVGNDSGFAKGLSYLLVAQKCQEPLSMPKNGYYKYKGKPDLQELLAMMLQGKRVF